MPNFLGRAADRLLTRFVPRMTAAAGGLLQPVVLLLLQLRPRLPQVLHLRWPRPDELLPAFRHLLIASVVGAGEVSPAPTTSHAAEFFRPLLLEE